MQMPFLDHLDELRTRLIKMLIIIGIATFVCFFGAEWMLALLLKPAPLQNESLAALQPASTFIQSMRLALVSGLVLSLPIVLYQIWAFVSPGLTKKESKTFLISLYAGTILFILGVLFAYFYVIPAALKFFWTYSEHLGVKPVWTIDHYINFVLMFLLSFGLAFELPVVLVLLVWLNIVSASTLASKRPYVIIGLAVLAAILTPPDVVSQILLLIPLWLLYEISIFVSKIL